MMEKYGVSLSDLPPSDGQLKLIKELCQKTGTKYFVPKNAEEANELIKKLAMEK